MYKFLISKYIALLKEYNLPPPLTEIDKIINPQLDAILKQTL